MMVLQGVGLMENSVESIEADTAGGSYCIVVGMKSGAVKRFAFETLGERDAGVELIMKHMRAYQRQQGEIVPDSFKI